MKMTKCDDMRLHFLVVLFIEHLFVSIETAESHAWLNGDTLIQAVCPYTEICHVSPSKSGPMDKCCTGCLCGTECISGYNCCLYNNSYSRYESCMYLRSKSNDKFGFTPAESSIFSHYVVTKAPSNGCHENKGNCNSEDASTLFPVYSRKTEMIYFNQDCATCHGLYEVEQPNYNLLCDDFGMSLSLNFDKEIDKFLDGDRSSFCFWEFDFRFHTSHRICLIHKSLTLDSFKGIQNRDNFKSLYNMSIEEVADACLSSFYSPVLNAANNKLYPNPFCYVYGEGTHDKETCYPSTGNLIGIDFTVLVNQEVKDFLRPDVKLDRINTNEACLSQEAAFNIPQYVRCRHVSCPLGHVSSKSGVCQFIGTRVFTNGRMNIFLNIILKSVHGNFVNHSKLLNLTFQSLTKATQLPTEWKIAFWGVSADFTHGGSPDKNDLLLILQLVINDIPKGMLSIRSHFDKEITILNEKFKIAIYPKKFVQDERFPRDILMVTQCSKENKISGIPGIVYNISTCWNIVDFSVEADIPIFVDGLSKLYFCELVQLTNGEYSLFANETILLNKIRGMYLHENEFLVQVGENGHRIVKICIDDSGLEIKYFNSAIKPSTLYLFEIGILVFHFVNGSIL